MPSSVYCASVHKTSILYKCIQNRFTVKQYTKPVYCTSIPKPVYCASVHKTSLLYKCNWSIKKGMYMDRHYLGMYRDGTLPRLGLCKQKHKCQGMYRGQNITHDMECTGDRKLNMGLIMQQNEQGMEHYRCQESTGNRKIFECLPRLVMFCPCTHQGLVKFNIGVDMDGTKLL